MLLTEATGFFCNYLWQFHRAGNHRMKNDGMDEMNIREYLENHKLLTDGAMGTYFDTVEKENYICSEEANITNPSLVRQIHKIM